VGEGGVASHQKKARRLNATLVFIDESGLLLAPVVRRSWAPRGQTPILYQRGRARDKVSILAALTLSPRRRRPGLYFSLRANENVTTAWLVPFLRALRRHLRGAFVLVWDRLPGHRAHVVTTYLHRRHRHVALLPPYAPELNPVEILWAYLKRNPLANFAASDAPGARRHAPRAAPPASPGALALLFRRDASLFFSWLGH
jgi:putative transposase